MKAAILTTCLVAVAIASPVRKARGLYSVSNEELWNINQQNSPSLFRPLNRYHRFVNQNNPFNRFSRFRLQNRNHHPKINFPNNYPNVYNPNFNDFNDNNPNLGYPNVLNVYPMRYKSIPSMDGRVYYLGQIGAQMGALSMSSETSNSMEDADTMSMEDAVAIIPGLADYQDPGLADYQYPGLADYQDPGLADYQDPGLSDYQGPIVPGVTDNGEDLGFDQTNLNEVDTEVANVLPYSDSMQNPELLGINYEDDSMFREGDGISRQDVMYEPAGADFNYDETLNNEGFADGENLDEMNETQTTGINSADSNPITSGGTNSNGDHLNQVNGLLFEEITDTTSIEGNLNPINTLDSEGDSDTISNEDDLNPINTLDSEGDIDTTSIEDDLNPINTLDSEGDSDTISNEDDLNPINTLDSEGDSDTISNEDDLNPINTLDSEGDSDTISNEDDLNPINTLDSEGDSDTISNEDDLNPINTLDSEGDIDTTSIEDDLNQINTLDSEGADSNDQNGASFNQGTNGEVAGPSEDGDNAEVDNIQNELSSCKNFRCRHGRVCELNEMGSPTCICQDMTSCPVSTPDLQQMCGTNNQTYENSCQFFASKCLLEGTEERHSMHLDYMGPCKYIAPCLNNELDEFPLRLRDWLKNILMHMYEQDLQSPGLLSQKERATIRNIYNDEQRLHPGDHSLDLLFNDFNQNYRMFIYPVHWQFSQLDRHPVDGYLTHSELAPLRDPLIPLEHCTSRFFTGCDADGDRDVSLSEWGTCFGLKQEDIHPNFDF